MGSNNNNVEIPNWLKKLPLAPTYYPTDTEFADPIAYISKIEKEASAFGICKVVPPLPKPAKKYVFSNLNKSLLKFPELSASPSSSSSQTTCSGDNVNNSRATNGEHSRGVFTTRHQELGSTLKKTKPQVSLHQSPVHKQVWQSGEAYTLEQFESKAKSFARNQLGMIKQVTPRVVEALFWKAASEKPIYIEYANDVPGSGFGEPEELSRYFHRRRRRRRRGQYNQNHQESPDNENHNTDASRNSYVNKEKIVFANNDSDSSSQPLNSSALSSDESSRFRREKSSTVGNDREGTAGWKLSNSPWNLQVIARSPGSLTRFMLDDIPGVTSPMIYIGMLFSWFAWHVEDHELHSLNFLHTGSSKTWYAVPGDYAFCFEEVIRSKGYGGDLDRLAALTLLGEKTNLLSPEVVIASGLPCCRLVQHPGEFVVTFPRAYHIGFSHGFNCGEAANFGTPQWLKVAKAAAVRRAAMNYLPMLSHQQLLYMLTMSFVSSVPRALHPGARTSRLKDRQKEERELLVKKAFVDDMLNEKYLFMALLGKESTFYGVLWDPEALPSPGTVPNNTSTVSALSTGITFVDHQCDDSYNNNIDSARMSMEALEEFYVGDDDLPCGLRVDSGTLPCVACGVLGFPFMSIVQPSRRASEELFPAECQVTQGLEVSRSMKPTAPSDLYDAVMKSTSDAHICDEHQKVSSAGRSKVRLTDNDLWNVYNDAINFEANETVELKETTSLLFQSNVDHPAVFGNSQVSLGQPLHSTGGSLKKWNTSNEFLRPRVFCLEHALEIEELLRTKGGANVLIICHSAYPKIKAHALAVAEEIGAPFDCDEIPLQCASKEDMNLITVSIEDDEHEECGEDWTSRLGLNLHYCVKLRKLSSTKQAQHALALGGLFSDVFSGLDHLSFKWKSRRSRTPYKTAGPRQSNSCGSVQIKKSEALLEVTLKRNAAEEHKVIQYSRRSSNHKVVSTLQTCGEHRGRSKMHHCRDVISNTGVLDKNISKDTLCCTENGANDSVELNKSFTVNSGVQHKDCAREEATEINEIFHPPRFSDLLSSENTHIDVSKLAKSSALKTSEVLHDECTIVVKEGTSDVCDPVKCEGLLAIKTIENDSELSRVPSVENHNVCVTEETREVREVSDYAVFSVSLAIASSEAETLEAPLKDHILDYEGDGAFNFVTVDTAKNQHMITLTDEKYEMSNIVADPMESPSSQPIVISSVEIETDTLEEDRVEYEVCNNAILGISERQVENQTTYAHSYLSSTTVESSEVRELQVLDVNKGGEVCSPAPDTMMRENSSSVMFKSQPTKKERCKRRRELDQITEDEWSYNGYIKSPCEGLRPRINRITTSAIRSDKTTEVETVRKKFKRSPNGSVTGKEKKVKDDELHKCDIEGCQLIFKTMGQLMMHKRNRCTHKGCGKQFRSHSYAMLHQRVHVDERPLKCSWKGCTMSFKWAWARTEHLRVHTGERPYQCKIEGCGLTFRFVSDFSRHRRKSGHYVDSPS